MVGQHEAAVHAAPPARAAQAHPAAGKGIAEIAEAPDPRRAGRGRRRDHQRASQAALGNLVHHHGGRQPHALVAVELVQRLHRAVADDGADGGVEPTQ